MRRTAATIAIPLAALTALAAWTAVQAAETGDVEPRASMQRVFAALAALLPDALDAGRFAEPARREAIQRELDRISGSAGELERHGRERDADFAWLGASLREELALAAESFRDGDLDESRYLLLVATRHCVACHSRLPSERDFPLAERLTEGVEVRRLAPRERAHFHVVTRNFDAALETWEAFFADPSVRPSQIETGDPLYDYLTLAVRVQRDAPRARRTLLRLARRPDAPAPLRDLSRAWAAALEALQPALEGPPDLDRAHAIVDEGTRLSALPQDRARAVHDLVASSLLYRWLDAHRAPGATSDARRAHAHYLLGRIEARSAEAYWVPRTEQNLERAIRLDPKGAWARPAWDLLENVVAGAYGGVDAATLPEDVRAHLLELARLIDAAPGAVRD